MIILNLILYNDIEEYNNMRDVLRYYLQKIGVYYFFYCYDENIKSEYKIDGDILRIRGKETYLPGIFKKTVKAIEICLKYEFDYIVRSNISSIIDFRLLNTYLKNRDVKYGGFYIMTQLLPNIEAGIYGFEYIGTKYVVGTCIILCKKIAKLLINNQNDINYDVIDDVGIGLFFKKYSIYPENLINEKNEDLFLINSRCACDNIILYRNKRNNRSADIKYIKNIIDQLLYHAKCDISDQGISESRYLHDLKDAKLEDFLFIAIIITFIICTIIII